MDIEKPHETVWIALGSTAARGRLVSHGSSFVKPGFVRHVFFVGATNNESLLSESILADY